MLKLLVKKELDYFFYRNKTGNLGTTSDILRFFKEVLRFIYSDMDVIFSKLPNEKIKAEYGFIARINNGKICNDMMAGNPDHPVFLQAKKNILKYYEWYHKQLPAFFEENKIEFSKNDYGNHPQYFALRNSWNSKNNLWSCGVGWGPNAFIQALHMYGFESGYHGREFIKKHEWVDKKTPSSNTVSEYFSKICPAELGDVKTEWDNSWDPNHNLF